MGKKAILASFVLATTLFSSTMNAEDNFNIHNEYYCQRTTLFSQLPIGKKDIIFLGDSQTNGCEWHELMGMSNVKGRGISADIVQGFIDRIDPIIEGQPAKLFILGGVNDLSHNVTPDSICRVMERLIVKVQQGSPRTKIYLQSLLPVDNRITIYRKMIGKEQDIIETNKLYKALAERLGVTFVDLYSKMVDPATGYMREGLTNDGLHVTGEGYLVWRDVVLPYVKK